MRTGTPSAMGGRDRVRSVRLETRLWCRWDISKALINKVFWKEGLGQTCEVGRDQVKTSGETELVSRAAPGETV